MSRLYNPVLAPVLALSLAVSLPVSGRAQEESAAASPFGFAESAAKAEHHAEVAAEMAQSGARVIGGEPAEPGAWPWQVAFMIAGRDRAPDTQFCGGTMILKDWVLTAAHCVRHTNKDGEEFTLPPHVFNVLVGAYHLSGGEGDLVPVKAVYPHPGYDKARFDNDIALVRLARVPNADFKTIKVPDAEFGDRLDQEGVPTYVTGWGLIEGAKTPDVMYEAKIQMLDRDACNGAMMQARARAAAQSFSRAAEVFSMDSASAQEAWEEMLRRAPLPMTENMLCSGTYEGGRTSCQGDSGGPLVVPLADGGYIQAGVVSWGLSAGPGKTCAEDALFSAYTRVSNYLPWLQQTIDANP